MSINVFKKHPGKKITFSDRSVLCSEVKGRSTGSRRQVIQKSRANNLRARHQRSPKPTRRPEADEIRH